MQSTDAKKPTGDGNPTAGSTDNAIVPNPACTGNTALALAYTTIQNAALRFWCATPSRWLRGRTHTKPKSHDLKQSHATCIFRGFRGFKGFSYLSHCFYLIFSETPAFGVRFQGFQRGFSNGRPYGKFLASNTPLAIAAQAQEAIKKVAILVAGAGYGTIATDAEKHHGLGRPESDKAQQPRPFRTAAFFMPTYCAWRTVSLMAGRVGTPARVCRYLIPVDQPNTVCHPCLVAWLAGFEPVDKEPIMANTPQGRTAPASPTDRATLRTDASSALALAAFHHRKGNHTAAARQAVLALKVLRKLQAFERTTSASPCTDCPENRPLPSGPLDFFDSQVVRGYIELRTACTLCPAGDKPCLKGGAA